MNRKFKGFGLVAVALVCALCVCLAACSKTNTEVVTYDGQEYEVNLIEKGTLTIGSDLDYWPFEFLEGDVPQGFEVALLQEMCNRTGLTCNFLSPQNFDTLPTQVASNSTMDIAASCLTITDERLEVVDFTDAWFQADQAVVIRPSDEGIYTDYRQLDGKTVCAQSGTTGYDWAVENLPNSEVIGLTNTSEAISLLLSGGAEAAIYDSPIAKAHAATLYLGDLMVLHVEPTSEEYGMMISKDNPGLTQLINAALVDIMADGTFGKLADEWHVI